jgi:hypothetical protein
MYMKVRRLFAVVVAVAAITTLISTNAYASGHDRLSKVRHVTARYQNLGVAQSAGYALLVDKDGISCIDMPGMGAMGVHYVRGDLVGDGKVDALHPEAVVYEPAGAGKVRLVALEYVVLKADWDAHHRAKPRLFGHKFDTTASPNRYGLPAYYSLHAWIFKDNPAGTFAMWNPRVHCPAGNPHHGHGGH